MKSITINAKAPNLAIINANRIMLYAQLPCMLNNIKDTRLVTIESVVVDLTKI